MSLVASVEGRILDGVGSITFSHPKGNSLPGELLRKLAAQIEQFGSDETVRVVVLQSLGAGAFCAGASFEELRGISTIEAAKDFFMGFARVILALSGCPKLTIARVHGKAVGGGVGLVAACDYSVALKSSSVRLSELALGIGPFVIGPCVERRIGISHFSTMAVGTQWHSAEWGVQAGLYSEAVETVEELDNRIAALTDQLKKNSREAVKALKEVLWEDTRGWSTLLPARAEITGRLLLSKECREIVEALP